MSDLDDKLREISIDVGLTIYDQTGTEPTQIRAKLSEENIAQIKQAFADEGYIQVPEVTKQADGWVDVLHAQKVRQNRVVLKSGQEWYDRYANELDRIIEDDYGQSPLRKVSLEAAKRAAGLTDD